ncbi:MAG TPA: serine/threonine-protein kinase [Actinomycetospora sp.]|jgi:serine/threonine protein kinase|uniref:serine/threonine-protein kinase n=1 Tax=Actinomycetospora sp. TaxID=1872135 RepID=UPI002F3FA911
MAPGYVVVEHVQRGRELDCYEIWSTDRRCRCFAKALRSDRLTDLGARGDLDTEAQVLLALTHPHIVRAYAYLEPGLSERHPPVLVLENLPGATLAALLASPASTVERDDDGSRRRGGRLGAVDLGHLGQHLCSALGYLHAQGYLHLDVKPSNVIASQGIARLIDLGLARSPGLGTPGAGTPGYMAPEQLAGEPLTAATDVWGLGLVLYEAATGFAPFEVPDPHLSGRCPDTLTRYESRLDRPAPALRARRRLPRRSATTIDACLARDPGRRPTLDQLADALNELTGRPDLIRHPTPAGQPCTARE